MLNTRCVGSFYSGELSSFGTRYVMAVTRKEAGRCQQRSRAQRPAREKHLEAARGTLLSVSLATCGRELCCARGCCARSARRGGRKPRGKSEKCKTTGTTPTDWCVLLFINVLIDRLIIRESLNQQCPLHFSFISV